MPRNKDPFARDKQAPLLAKHRAAHKPPTEAVGQRRLEVWRLRTEERMTVSRSRNSLVFQPRSSMTILTTSMTRS